MRDVWQYCAGTGARLHDGCDASMRYSFHSIPSLPAPGHAVRSCRSSSPLAIFCGGTKNSADCPTKSGWHGRTTDVFLLQAFLSCAFGPGLTSSSFSKSRLPARADLCQFDTVLGTRLFQPWSRNTTFDLLLPHCTRFNHIEQCQYIYTRSPVLELHRGQIDRSLTK